MSVAELKEKLNKFPDYCEVVFKSHYYDDYHIEQLAKHHEIDDISLNKLSNIVEIIVSGF
jgi:hypothetical protein